MDIEFVLVIMRGFQIMVGNKININMHSVMLFCTCLSKVN